MAASGESAPRSRYAASTPTDAPRHGLTVAPLNPLRYWGGKTSRLYGCVALPVPNHRKEIAVRAARKRVAAIAVATGAVERDCLPKC